MRCLERPERLAEAAHFGGGGLVQVAGDQIARAVAGDWPAHADAELRLAEPQRKHRRARAPMRRPTRCRARRAGRGRPRPRSTSGCGRSRRACVRDASRSLIGDTLTRRPRPASARSSSCRRAARRRRRTPDLADARARGCRPRRGRAAPATTRASAASPKRSPVVVHRLGDAVGVQHDRRRPARIGRVCSSSSSLEPLGRARQPQAEHHAVGHDRRRSRRPETTMSGVCPARAQVSVPRFEIDDGVGHRDEAAVVEVVREQPVDVDEQLPRRLARVWLSDSIRPFSSAM